MEIRSASFENNEDMPLRFSCDGEGVNPELKFSNVSENAKSLALIVFDPDAPGGGYTHWVLYNIDPQIKEIKENSCPANCTQGINSSGGTDFVAACPPFGKHRYIFTLYALNMKINKSSLDKSGLEEEMKNHILEKTQLTGLYQRN